MLYDVAVCADFVPAQCIVHHELAKYDPGFTLAYLAHAMLFVNNFYHCANDEQRARYLPKVTPDRPQDVT